MSLDFDHTPRTHTPRGVTKPRIYVLHNVGNHDKTTVHVCTLCGVAYDPQVAQVCAGKTTATLSGLVANIARLLE
jgi:hypothetical protein